MIFQDPMTSLNPFLKISTQLMEVTQLHLGHSKQQAREHAIKMLETVGIPDAKNRIDGYPHEFSGGMRQRVMIAMALSCDPELLIADEPTTALDVTIQAQILELIKDLKARMGTSVILITHDLGVVAGMTEKIIVMYAGKVFEQAPTAELFSTSANPYTKGLLKSFPIRRTKRERIFIKFPDCRRMSRICRPAARSRRDATAPKMFVIETFRRLCKSTKIIGRCAILQRKFTRNHYKRKPQRQCFGSAD
jgi:oligopeptide transport system ATP-binding protein